MLGIYTDFTKNPEFYTFLEILGISLEISTISNSRCEKPSISKFRLKSKVFNRNTRYFDWNTRFFIWNARYLENVWRLYSIGNKDQKNSEYGYFSRSICFSKMVKWLFCTKSVLIMGWLWWYLTLSLRRRILWWK